LIVINSNRQEHLVASNLHVGSTKPVYVDLTMLPRADIVSLKVMGALIPGSGAKDRSTLFFQGIQSERATTGIEI
jgi:hypothetical protein